MKKAVFTLSVMISLTACGQYPQRVSPDFVASIVAGTLTALPPATPAATSGADSALNSAGWIVYTHPAQPFSLKIPADFEIYPDRQASAPYLGGNIQILYREKTFEDCQGECPTIENKESVVIAGQEAARFTGSIGSLGDTNPQQFLAYEINHKGLHYIFALYALRHDAPFIDASVIQPLKEADILLFNEIMQTLTFTD